MNSYLLKTPSGKLHRCRCIERARTLLSARKLHCKTAQCCSFLACVTQSVADFGSCCASCWCQKQLKNWHRRSLGRGDLWHCITSSVLSQQPSIQALPCVSMFSFQWYQPPNLGTGRSTRNLTRCSRNQCGSHHSCLLRHSIELQFLHASWTLKTVQRSNPGLNGKGRH